MTPDSNFKRYFLYSISFHALVFILLLLFGRSVEFEPLPKTQVTMIRLIRGESEDGQILKTSSSGTAPAQTPATPPAPPPAEAPPKPEPPKTPPPPAAKTPEQKVAKPQAPPKPETGVRLPDKETPRPAKPTPPAPKTSAEDEQKMASALSGIHQELEQREKQAAAAPNPPGGEGPGSSGPAFGSPGGGVAPQDAELAQYRSQVRSKIIREWVRTAVGGSGETMRVRILVRINASGAVISRSFAKQSGDAAFDNSALRAVERASPLPPPPPSAQAEALTEGFVIDFSSRMLGR